MTLTPPRGVLTVSGACFVGLAAAAILVGALPADATIRDWLLGLATPSVIALMRVVNYAGDWRVLLPGTLLLFVVFDRARRRWWVWAGLMVAAPAIEGTLKILVARPRPEGVAMGFPSGHATAAAAFFGAVMYLAGSLPAPACRLVRIAAALCALLVGLARVLLGAHWPSDVVAGIALGLALASAAALAASAQSP
jgi:undecaprenyl-diphosphatase